MPATTLFYGTIVTSDDARQLIILEDGLLGVDESGFISHYEKADTAASQALLNSTATSKIIKFEGFLLPGFVDTHIHAPQYMQAGLALDKPLMEWLVHYTFAAEAKIDADPNRFGRKVYKRLVQRMIENGTTAASVFGTLTVEANLVLAKCFLEAGLRGQIGKVNMDLNGIENYIETTSSSLAGTQKFTDSMRELTKSLPPHLRLVEPVITPRFVPTCSSELLTGLSELAEEHGLRIQSHACESAGQVEWSKKMWGGKSDVRVLHEHGLLTAKSLMAHCTHATAEDLSLFSTQGTSISHCPLSNVYFSAEQQFPLREALDAEISVGLGSDVSGGYAIGLDNSMRWAVGVSRLRAGQDLPPLSSGVTRAITWKESIYLATLGGANSLGLNSGKFAVGKSFDAQLIRLGTARSRVDLDLSDRELSIEDKIEKWWCLGTEIDRSGVWVQGKRIRNLDLVE